MSSHYEAQLHHAVPKVNITNKIRASLPFGTDHAPVVCKFLIYQDSKYLK